MVMIIRISKLILSIFAATQHANYVMREGLVLKPRFIHHAHEHDFANFSPIYKFIVYLHSLGWKTKSGQIHSRCF